MKMTDDEKQVVVDYRATFNTEHGKRVLERMKKKAKFHMGSKPKKADGDIAVNELVWLAAQRSVVIDIINTMNKEIK